LKRPSRQGDKIVVHKKKLKKERKGKKRAQQKRKAEMAKASPQTIRRMNLEAIEKLPHEKKMLLMQTAYTPLEAKRQSLLKEIKGMGIDTERTQKTKMLEKITSDCTNLEKAYMKAVSFNEKIPGSKETPAELLLRLFGTNWRDHIKKKKQ
jgi:hypothetical protein